MKARCFLLVLLTLLSVTSFHASEKQIIAIFTGSFDPVHNGHVEMIDYLLREEIAQMVIVQPDSGVCQSKPNRLPVAIRKQMLEVQFHEEPRVIISLDYQKTISQRFNRTEIDLLGVMGSDNYIRLLDMPTCPHMGMDAWVVFMREADQDHPVFQSSCLLDGVSVSIVDAHQMLYADCSSTKVRRMIMELSASDIAQTLSPWLWKFIHQNELYIS